MKFLKQNLIVVTLFLVVFGLYLTTAPHAPTNYADSNELITASYTLGIPHPPGYPLFVLIGKFFSYIPISTIAFRYAIMSSFFGAATVVLVYLTLLKIFSRSQKVNSEQRTENSGQENRKQKTENSENSKHLIYAVIPALVGALSLAFSYLFWLYSIVPEVFALSNFFAALIIFLGVSWYYDSKVQSSQPEAGPPRAEKFKVQSQLRRFIGEKDYYPVMIAITSSLGFLAHQTIVFLAPALIYLIWITDKSLFRSLKRWLKIVAGFIVGLLPSLYFPIISYIKTPVIDFGNVTSPKMFWRLMSRYYYKPGNPVSAYVPQDFDISTKLYGLGNYIETLNFSFMLPLFLLGIMGLFVAFLFVLRAGGRQDRIKNFIALSFVFSGLFLAVYAALSSANSSYDAFGVYERLYIMSFIPLAALAGIGAHFIIENARRNIMPVTIVLLVFFSVAPLYFNYSLADKSDFYLAEDYARNLLVNLEPDSILIAGGYQTNFALSYWQHVENLRPDVSIVSYDYTLEWNRDRFREKYKGELFDIEHESDTFLLRDIIEYNIGKRPVYVTWLSRPAMARLGINDNPYTLSPRGLVREVTEEFELHEDKDYWPKLSWRNSKKADDYFDWFAKDVIYRYILGRNDNFVQYMRYGYYDLAEAELREMRSMDSSHPVVVRAEEVFNKTGKTEREVEEYAPSAAELERETTLLLRQGQRLAAMGNLLHLVELYPDNPTYHYNLGGIYMGYNWLQKAKKEYEIVIELNPKDTKAREKLNDIKLLELR